MTILGNKMTFDSNAMPENNTSPVFNNLAKLCGFKIITFDTISETFYIVTYLEPIRKALRDSM